MSLASAIYRKLQSTAIPNWRNLRAMLSEYGSDGYYGTNAATRTQIKLALNSLITETIQEQDIIVCTLAAAAKVNLATNFKPVATFLDEAGRVPEAKSLIVTSMFPGAKVHFRVGDHLQISPHYASERREKDIVPFLNPFSPQYKMSEFERFIRNGVEHTLLTV
jgi:hypothetical protein